MILSPSQVSTAINAWNTEYSNFMLNINFKLQLAIFKIRLAEDLQSEALILVERVQ